MFLFFYRRAAVYINQPQLTGVNDLVWLMIHDKKNNHLCYDYVCCTWLNERSFSILSNIVCPLLASVRMIMEDICWELFICFLLVQVIQHKESLQRLFSDVSRNQHIITSL